MTTLPAGRVLILPPRDALDPIATPAPGDSPTYDALLAAFKRAGLADYLVGEGVPRDARGRFCKRGQR